MADQTNELRRLVRQAKQDEAREDPVRAAFKTILHSSAEDRVELGVARHHEVFGVPQSEKSADFVVTNGPHSLIISEAKASNIDHALEQLTNLAADVHRKFPLLALEFHILVREGTDPDNLMPAKNQPPKYRAKTTKETLLRGSKYLLTDGKGEPVRIVLSPREPGTKVFVIIGPRSGK